MKVTDIRDYDLTRGTRVSDTQNGQNRKDLCGPDTFHE